MGKISPVSIKYVIHAKFEAIGSVEKPDVIGALFGQTEGLLGSELEMRELQKEGKIGRIDVDLESENGKTLGNIQIPTALDKAETALIAAAIETIDRIGPTDAKIEVEKIEDVRGEKRNFIVDRAKKLLESIEGENETREMAETLKTQSRLSKLQDYGNEKLPAGDISEHEIIVVEGRADVITLLKNGVGNVIAMNGTILPETIKELSYDKEITLFIDGDRGGKLIAKNAYDNARIDYIAYAPDGKEVEELSGKEILSALRKKIPAREFFRSDDRERREYRFEDQRRFREDKERFREEPEKAEEEEKEISIGDKEKEKLKEMMNELEGSKEAYLLDGNLEAVKRVSSSGIAQALIRVRRKIYGLVIGGVVNSFVIRAAEKKNIKFIAAKNFTFTDTSINLLSF